MNQPVLSSLKAQHKAYSPSPAKIELNTYFLDQIENSMLICMSYSAFQLFVT